MKRLLALLCALALLGSLTACAETAVDAPAESPEATPESTPISYVEPDQFTLGYSAADSLHPMQASDQSSMDVDTLVYEGLFRLDEQFEAQPVLAESAAVAADGLTWTITLRSDVFFSDGTTLTAGHAASSLLAAVQSARYSARLAAVADVQAVDDRTLTVTLSTPNGALPALLDIPIFLEREDDLPLGTGPYAFARNGEELYLRFNPAWWEGAAPPYETIALRGYSSREDRVNAFGSGEVSAVTCDFNASDALGYSGTYETHDYATTVMLYLGFNTAKGRLCASSPLRVAISRALDRDTMASVLMAGHGDGAALPVSPASPLYNASAAELLSFDPDGAAALLEEAGWTRNDDGLLTQWRSTLSLTLVVNRDNALKRAIAENVAQALEELGASVTVETLEWESYTAALAAGDFDLYIGEVKLTADFDFSALVAGELNYGAYAGETLLAALNRYRAASGASRTAEARTLYEAFAAEAPFAVLCFKRQSLLARWGMVGSLSPLQGQPFYGIKSWVALS